MGGRSWLVHVPLLIDHIRDADRLHSPEPELGAALLDKLHLKPEYQVTAISRLRASWPRNELG